MSDPIGLLEERLQGKGLKVRRRGDGISAQCPAHDDKSPSMDARPGRDRDVVLYCHAGCAPDAIMAALNLTWTDFGSTNGSTPGSRKEVVATYDYTDATGKMLYQVVRYQPKDFRQRRPDGNGWKWGLGDVERTLYRLPAVLEAAQAGGTIYIVEGEKDADRLTVEGVCATTCSGGAGRFSYEMAGHLQGASQAIIVADNDGPGGDHAAQVGFMLATVNVPCRIVHAATGKDAFDHLAAGHSLDDWVDANIKVKEPPPHPLAAFLVDWDAMWARDTSAQEWLLEPVLAKGRGHALYATAKSGKSWVALYLAAALATGKPVLGHPGGQPTDVLYCDYEMTLDDLRERLEDFGYGPDDDMSHLHYALQPGTGGLDTDRGGEALVDTAVALGVQLVVVDTVARAVEGEENEADTFRRLYRHTGTGLKRHGITYLRIDHAGKDAERGQRGSSSKNDDVDVVIRLDSADNGKEWIATHRRLGWYPDKVHLHVDETEGTFTIELADRGYPDGTGEAVDDLERLKVPVDATASTAAMALRDDGCGRRRAVVQAAQRYRKAAADYQAQTDEIEDLLP